MQSSLPARDEADPGRNEFTLPGKFGRNLALSQPLEEMMAEDPRTKDIIPSQVTGKRSGAAHMIELPDLNSAGRKFEQARARLRDVNKWGVWSGTGSAEFRLTDERGNTCAGPPEVGNLIRIDIPGPGSKKGHGYDWVRIAEITDQRTEDSEVFAIRVRPVSAPGTSHSEASHFYTKHATSTFMVKRKGRRVSALEEGRNEKMNTDSPGLLDRIRNFFVASGAQAGLAAVQWKMLVKGVLE
jgi:hypothetical protein